MSSGAALAEPGVDGRAEVIAEEGAGAVGADAKGRGVDGFHLVRRGEEPGHVPAEGVDPVLVGSPGVELKSTGTSDSPVGPSMPPGVGASARIRPASGLP